MSTNEKKAAWEYDLLTARSMPELVRMANAASKEGWELVGVSHDPCELSSKLDKVIDAIRRISVMPHDGWSIPLMVSSPIGSLRPSIYGVVKRPVGA